MIKREELTNPASCMSRAAEDEMTFVLLGRDVAAPAAIRAWIAERVSSGKNSPTDPQILEARECAAQMELHQGPSGCEISPSRESVDAAVPSLTIERLRQIQRERNGLVTHAHRFGSDEHYFREMFKLADEAAGIYKARLAQEVEVSKRQDALIDHLQQLSTAKELRPGALYALEVRQPLNDAAARNIKESLRPFQEEFGVKFLILDRDLRISEPCSVDGVAEAVVKKLNALKAKDLGSDQ